MKCCRETTWRSVVEELWRGVVAKCCREVLWRSAIETCCEEVL